MKNLEAGQQWIAKIMGKQVKILIARVNGENIAVKTLPRHTYSKCLNFKISDIEFIKKTR